MTARTLLCALLATASVACASSNDTAPEPRAAEVASNPDDLQAKAVLLEGELEADKVQALAKHLEGLAEVHSVEIAIEKTSDGPTRARLTLGGLDMPSSEELRAAVDDFDGLGDASIAIEDAEVPKGPAAELDLSASDDKSPEEVQAEVVEKLRAQGVEGDIHVKVHDEDGERRVEVRVEDHKTDEGELKAK